MMDQRRVGMGVDDAGIDDNVILCFQRRQVVATDNGIGVLTIDQALEGLHDGVRSALPGVDKMGFDRTAEDAAHGIDLFGRHLKSVLEFQTIGRAPAGHHGALTDRDRLSVGGATLIDTGQKSGGRCGDTHADSGGSLQE